MSTFTFLDPFVCFCLSTFAFKDENKSEHFKRIKQTERDILLQNIRSLPDKPDEELGVDESGQELLDAAFNSPNPNFIVLDADLLESFKKEIEEMEAEAATAELALIQQAQQKEENKEREPQS